jgi:UDP-glucose 4-epimerase
MKALVTGGCGFIGSHIVDLLVSKGVQVRVIDNLSSEFHDQFYFNDAAEYHHEDICDYDQVEKVMGGIDYVFHLAAHSRIQPSIENPLSAVSVNTMGTMNILEAARQAGVKRVMFSSTSSAYGLTNQPPLVETMRTNCLNPYSVSKVAGEELCRIYSEIYGLETIIFRYFNVYGNREPLRGVYAPVVGRFLNLFKNNEPLTIVGDGLQRRDFTHVSDVAHANWLASQTESEEAFGDFFNVGAGENYSVMELAEMIGGERVHIPERIGEARETLADISKIKSVLGWEPKMNFNEYIEREMNND